MTEHNETVVAETPEVEAAPAVDEGQVAAGDVSPEPAGAEAPADWTTDASTDDTLQDAGTSPDAVETEGDTADTTAGTRRRPAKVADLEREGEVAADFLETLLDIADLDGDIDVDVDGDRAAVSIVDSDEGRVPRRLVGQDGKVLEALQELTRLAVQSATGERSRLMLDVAGHRAERRSSLVAIAHTAIEQVKASGEKAALDPMTAFERKVVHDEVLAAGLSSESDGVEPKRYVVILPA
jgi:spoIIIJ-associated protein